MIRERKFVWACHSLIDPPQKSSTIEGGPEARRGGGWMTKKVSGRENPPTDPPRIQTQSRGPWMGIKRVRPVCRVFHRKEKSSGCGPRVFHQDGWIASRSETSKWKKAHRRHSKFEILPTSWRAPRAWARSEPLWYGTEKARPPYSSLLFSHARIRDEMPE